MPDVTFSKTMPAIDGNPNVSFKPQEHRGQSTFKNVALPAGMQTPHLRDGSIYISHVSDKSRHKSQNPADGKGLIRKSPILEVIH
jgi:hypothetical protein